MSLEYTLFAILHAMRVLDQDQRVNSLKSMKIFASLLYYDRCFQFKIEDFYMQLNQR